MPQDRRVQRSIGKHYWPMLQSETIYPILARDAECLKRAIAPWWWNTVHATVDYGCDRPKRPTTNKRCPSRRPH